MTLRGRLALVNVIVMLIALLLLAAIVLNQLVHDLYEQLDRELGLIGARELTRVDIETADGEDDSSPEGAEFMKLLYRQIK